MFTIVIVCHNCQQVNKQELGMPGFELLDCRFETFSGAHQHMINNPDHYMTMVGIEENEEE